mmetsp:Transcript_26304/g.61598  ORF Transcript_26304/g.61598 Transcript_26304/m.61598 type:complete len:230 (-) Transcript_26304:255-944(-)
MARIFWNEHRCAIGHGQLHFAHDAPVHPLVDVRKVQDSTHGRNRRPVAASMLPGLVLQLHVQRRHNLTHNVWIFIVLEVLDDESAHVRNNCGTTPPCRVPLRMDACNVLCKISNRAVIANISVFEIFQSSPAGTEVDTEVESHLPYGLISHTEMCGQIHQGREVVDIELTHLHKASQHLVPSHVLKLFPAGTMPIKNLLAVDVPRNEEADHFSSNLLLQCHADRDNRLQ